MTDNEIIKALAMCNQNSCDSRKCPYAECGDTIIYCQPELHNDALNLINKQRSKINLLEYDFELLKQEKKVIENNVIQKFVEKLKTKHSTPDIFMPFNWISCEEMVLDEIAKELVGDEE